MGRSHSWFLTAILVLASGQGASAAFFKWQKADTPFHVITSTTTGAAFRSGDKVEVTIEQTCKTTVFKNLRVVGIGTSWGQRCNASIDVEVTVGQHEALSIAALDRWAKILIENQTPHPADSSSPVIQGEKASQELLKEAEERAKKHGATLSFAKNTKNREDYRIVTSLDRPPCPGGGYWNIRATNCPEGLQSAQGIVNVQALTGSDTVVWQSTAAYGNATMNENIGSRKTCSMDLCVSKRVQQRLETLERSGAQFDATQIH